MRGHVLGEHRLLAGKNLAADELRHLVVRRRPGAAGTVNEQLQFPRVLQREDGHDLGRGGAEHRVHRERAQFGRVGRGGHVEGEAVQHRDRLRRGDARVEPHRVRVGAGGRRGLLVAGLAEALADLQAVGLLRGPRGGLRHVRKLAHLVHVHEPGAADADLVERAQRAVGAERFAVEVRAVQAAQVADVPPALDREHLGVFAAAQVVAEDDAAGRRAAERVPRAVV